MTQKQKHTLAIIAALVVATGPQVYDILDDLPWKWAKAAGVLVGLAIALFTNKNLVALIGTPAETPQEKPKDGGFTFLPIMLFLWSVALGLLLTYPAHAEESPPAPQLGTTVGKWTLQPAAALSAFQLNMKTGDYERVALMGGYGITWRGPVALGAAVYAGIGVSGTSPNAAQGNLLFNIEDWIAFGPGFQVFKGHDGSAIWQGLFTVAVNHNIGSSTSGLTKYLGKCSAP
jgi:hypothetical protein